MLCVCSVITTTTRTKVCRKDISRIISAINRKLGVVETCGPGTSQDEPGTRRTKNDEMSPIATHSFQSPQIVLDSNFYVKHRHFCMWYRCSPAVTNGLEKNAEEQHAHPVMRMRNFPMIPAGIRRIGSHQLPATLAALY